MGAVGSWITEPDCGLLYTSMWRYEYEARSRQEFAGRHSGAISTPLV